MEGILPIDVTIVGAGAAGLGCAMSLRRRGVERMPDDEESTIAAMSNWKEPYGDRRQELVVIGSIEKMDEPFLRDCFDACLLTDAEMAGGLDAWDGFPDPFSCWDHDEAEAEPAAVGLEDEYQPSR